MARVLLAMLAVMSLTAFAPAPFPKAQRRDVAGISLESLRGTWRAVKFESITPQGGRSEIGLWFQQVRVQDDQWFYIANGKENPSYRIVVDGAKKPATIDFYSRGA